MVVSRCFSFEVSSVCLLSEAYNRLAAVLEGDGWSIVSSRLYERFVSRKCSVYGPVVICSKNRNASGGDSVESWCSFGSESDDIFKEPDMQNVGLDEEVDRVVSEALKGLCYGGTESKSKFSDNPKGKDYDEEIDRIVSEALEGVCRGGLKDTLDYLCEKAGGVSDEELDRIVSEVLKDRHYGGSKISKKSLDKQIEEISDRLADNIVESIFRGI